MRRNSSSPPDGCAPVGDRLLRRSTHRMRSLVFALCAAFAVLLTAAPSHAHQSQVRCFGALASHQLMDQEQVTSFVKTSKQVAAPSGPTRSQAPTLCSDPSQPGCQVDRPDAPRHHGSWDLHHEPVDLTSAVPEVPPQAVDDVEPAFQFHGGPRVGSAQTPWRPPSA